VKEEKRLALALFLVSSGALAFETVLFRVFTFIFGYHFVSLLVALALLGYGIAGSFAPRFPGWFKNDALFYFGCFVISFWTALVFLPFDVYELFVKPYYFLSLCFLVLLSLFPFLAHGLLQVVAFERFPRRFPHFYGLNLLGSACGIALALLTLSVLSEARALLVLALLGFLGGLSRWRWLCLALVVCLLWLPLGMRLSPYLPSKSLLLVPETTLLATYRNPFEVLEVFSVPSMRVGSGLSVRFQGVPPSAFALVFDHHQLELFPREVTDDFLEALLFNLPLWNERYEKVLVVEGRGGLEAYVSWYAGVQEITLVTASQAFARFVEGLVPSFPARVVVASSRHFLERSEEMYDVIFLRVPVGRASVFPGSFSFVEDFLFTAEGARLLLERIREGGMVVFSFFLQNPPSLLPKLVSLLGSAYGKKELARSLVVVKSLDFALLLVKKAGWEKSEVVLLSEELEKHRFDWVYFPGGKLEEMERVFDTGKRYARVVEELLFKGEEGSVFDIRPATDLRPYFRNFFRFSQIRETWNNLRKRWLPFGGAGFLLVLVVLFMVVVFALVALFYPLWRKRRKHLPKKAKLFIIASICTGAGFMFLEISLFVLLSLFVGIPLYTFSLLLVVLLVGSGSGSAWVQSQLEWGKTGKFAISHLLSLGGCLFLLVFFKEGLLTLPFLVLVPLFVISFTSGMPFPWLSQKVHRTDPSLFPLIFAYNGFFSVVSSLLAHLLVVFWGLHWAFAVAFLAYLVFWWMIGKDKAIFLATSG